MTLFLKAPLLLNTSPSNILIAFFWVEEMLGAKKGFFSIIVPCGKEAVVSAMALFWLPSDGEESIEKAIYNISCSSSLGVL